MKRKHGIVGMLVLIYQPVLIASHFWLVDLSVLWFFTVTISTFVSGLMFKVFLLAMRLHTSKQELMADTAENKE